MLTIVKHSVNDYENDFTSGDALPISSSNSERTSKCF
jgi:hypothetical protein